MFRIKSILIAIAMICSLLLIGIVNNSEAFEIIDFPSDLEAQSWGGYSMYSAYLKTDVPYLWVEWWIGDTLVDIEWGDGTKTQSYYSPNDLTPGHVQGTKYKITGYATFTDVEDVDWDALPWNWEYAWMLLRYMDFDSYTVRMFESKSISGTKYPRAMAKNKRGTGIYGSVELNRHYHDGQNIVVDASVYAYNGTKETVHAVSWFRHTQFKDLDGDGLDETVWSQEDPPEGMPNPYKGELSPGTTYSKSGSSSISFPVDTDDGNIGPEQRIKLNAHIHMAVGGRVWHEENGAWTHTFDYKDNESYEGD